MKITHQLHWYRPRSIKGSTNCKATM